MAQLRRDEEERRSLTGAHAPKPGVCAVCTGEVQAQVSYPHTDLIGGPPQQAYVAGWECDGCGLLYDRRPGPRT
jgi:hypothetical protein